MKTQDIKTKLLEKKIEKLIDIVDELDNYSEESQDRLLINRLRSEISDIDNNLSVLKSAKDNPDRSTESMRDVKEEKPQFNYFQSRDLTDAEWLAMPKEEILQLYKNCYKLLMENFKPQPVQSVKGEGERTDDMIDFILEIDFLTTTEFCKKYNVPEPIFTGDVKSSADQLLRIDAIKHRMFVEKAKELRRNPKHSESKDMYPKEFIEFLCDYYQKFWDRYILLNGEHVDPFNTKQPFFTFEEVFNHWSTVVTKR